MPRSHRCRCRRFGLLPGSGASCDGSRLARRMAFDPVGAEKSSARPVGATRHASLRRDRREWLSLTGGVALAAVARAVLLPVRRAEET